jgi:hypothetical protein
LNPSIATHTASPLFLSHRAQQVKPVNINPWNEIPGIGDITNPDTEVSRRWWFWVVIGGIAALFIVFSYFAWRGFRNWRRVKASSYDAGDKQNGRVQVVDADGRSNNNSSNKLAEVVVVRSGDPPPPPLLPKHGRKPSEAASIASTVSSQGSYSREEVERRAARGATHRHSRTTSSDVTAMMMEAGDMVGGGRSLSAPQLLLVSSSGRVATVPEERDL